MAKTVRQLTSKELQQFDPTRNLANSLDAERWAKAWAKLPELLTVLRERFCGKASRYFWFFSCQRHLYPLV